MIKRQYGKWVDYKRSVAIKNALSSMGMTEAQRKHASVMGGILTVCMCILPSALMAMTAATSGQPGYDFWDIIVTKGLKGPIGSVIGTGLFAAGMFGLYKQQLGAAAGAMAAGAGIWQCDKIATSFGAIF